MAYFYDLENETKYFMTTGIYASYEKSAHKRKITSDTSYKPLYEHKLYKIPTFRFRLSSGVSPKLSGELLLSSDKEAGLFSLIKAAGDLT